MGLGFKNYFYWMRLVMLLSDIHDVKDGRLITKDAFGRLPDGSGFMTGTIDDSKEIIFQGIPITVENKPGSVRKDEDENGE